MVMLEEEQIEELLRINYLSDGENNENKIQQYIFDIGNSTSNSNSMVPLPQDYVPGPLDVICARGKHAKNHSGNLRFRKKIKEVTPQYARAETKLYKSMVVSSVIAHVRNNTTSNGGFFVKQIDGIWYDVGDNQAREKVGQALRDQLHGHYRSSTKSKRRRWKKEEEERTRNRKKKVSRSISPLDQLMQKNHEVCHRMKQIEQSRFQAGGDYASDDLMVGMFTENNISLLHALKADPKLQEGIQQLANHIEDV